MLATQAHVSMCKRKWLTMANLNVQLALIWND